MCGIAGILKLRGGCVDRSVLAEMIAKLRHRGPDEQGIHLANEAGLAHTRLAIIDVAGGQQPMCIEDGRLWITFNGEIFNYVELREELIKKGHTFSTRSDTEVILHLFQEEGEDCVKRLNGQWSFAIWDAACRKLFLSRDRIGVRPLFYTQTSDSFLFASEIKALAACPDVILDLDLEALDQVFSLWVTIPPKTAFRNVRQLPPGHSMTVEDGNIRVSRYWHLESAPEEWVPGESENTLTEQLLSLMLDATRIRLRSDVPVGAYLSGGLDSTFITALAKQLVGDNLRTFSVAFSDGEFDESPFQNEASTYLKTEHSRVLCESNDIAAVFPGVVWQCEQPILRTAPAPLYLLAKLVREAGFKVVLTGEGADEMLGGYDIFKETKIRSFWARFPDSQWRPLLLKRLYPYMAAMQRQQPAYLKKFFYVRHEDLSNPFFSHLPRWAVTASTKIFFSDEVKAETQSANALTNLEQALPNEFDSWTPFTKAEYLEAMYLLPGYILSSQGDRMAMAHSVEGRYPFLDFRLIEFAAKLPTRLKMKVLDQKYLLKRAASGLIPSSIQHRYKQPYRAPDGESFFINPHEYVEELLSFERIKKDGIFNPSAVTGLVKKFKSQSGTSVKDDMAFVGILSTQLLLNQFSKHREPIGSLHACETRS